MFVRSCLIGLLCLIVVPASFGQPAQAPTGGGLQPNALAVAKVKLQSKDKLYAQAGQALVVVEVDGNNVLVQSPDGKTKLRVAANSLTPLSEAAPLYTRLIKATPTDPNLFLARSNAYAARRDWEAAEADLRQAVKLDDQYEAAYVALAEAQMQQEDFDAVFATVEEAMKIDDTNPTYHVLIGVAYRRMEKFPEAIAAFTEALKHKPDHVPALSSRGFIYYLTKHHDLAVKDFDAWVKLDPSSAMAVNNRGYNRQFIGDYAGALADYNKAIELSPQFALAFQNKAWLLATCPDDKYRDGPAAFEAASKACVMRKYSVPEDLKALAAAYAELKDFKHAAEFQQRVVDAKQGEAKEVEQRVLEVYEQNRPFRFTPSPPQE